LSGFTPDKIVQLIRRLEILAMHATQSPSIWNKIWRPALAGAVVISLLLVIAAGASVWRDLGDSGPALVYYTAAKADLPIVVTERGSL
jgi:hypothetical protein